MTPQTRTRLLKLLPRLSAVTDARRLKAMSDVDRVLAAEGLTWADIADFLEERTNVVTEVNADEALAMADIVSQHADLLSDNARDFLGQVVRKVIAAREATQQPGHYMFGKEAVIELSARQIKWLLDLHGKAKAERERPVPEVVASPPTAALH